MRIANSLLNQCAKALAESMDTHTMCMIAKKLAPDYDIYERTGYPTSIAIPNLEVANQIVNDAAVSGLFPNLVSYLIEIQESGHMGRKYPISYLNNIIRGVYELGFVYDKENEMFVENSRYRQTRNWGALQKGHEYTIAFLRVDIAGNTSLVRQHSTEEVEKAYDDLRAIVLNSTLKRNGRMWSWEGDGGLAAFFFSNRHLLATLAAMEIIHSIFLYNCIDNKLKTPLTVRIAVHSGSFEYTEKEEELTKSDTIKRILEIESTHTKPNAITISPVIKVMLDEIVSNKFLPITSRGDRKLYAYELEWEPV